MFAVRPEALRPAGGRTARALDHGPLPAWRGDETLKPSPRFSRSKRMRAHNARPGVPRHRSRLAHVQACPRPGRARFDARPTKRRTPGSSHRRWLPWNFLAWRSRSQRWQTRPLGCSHRCWRCIEPGRRSSGLRVRAQLTSPKLRTLPRTRVRVHVDSSRPRTTSEVRPTCVTDRLHPPWRRRERRERAFDRKLARLAMLAWIGAEMSRRLFVTLRCLSIRSQAPRGWRRPLSGPPDMTSPSRSDSLEFFRGTSSRSRRPTM